MGLSFGDRGLMTRRNALRLAAVSSAGLLLPGCGRSGQPVVDSHDSASADVPTGAQLQAMLDRRARAQRDGDERAYLADLDANNDELVRRERMVFDNLRQFPVEDLQFVGVPPEGIPDEFEPEPMPREAYVDEEAWEREWGDWRPSGPWHFVPVVKVVRLATDDRTDGVLGPGETYEYTVARRNGGWVIADIVPFAGEEFDRRRGNLMGRELSSPERFARADAPWNLDPLHVIRAGNVWLAGDDSVDDLDRYAAAAEIEAAQVESMWGSRPRFPGHVMFFTRDHGRLGAWFDLRRALDLDRFTGVALPRPGVRDNGEVLSAQHASARMAINLSLTEEYTDDPRSTMRHELVHAVTARAEGTGDRLGFPARWAVEGFARYIEVRGDADRERTQRYWAAQGVGRGIVPAGALPRSLGFYAGDREAVAGRYALGYTLFRYVEQLRDMETAIDLYEEVIRFHDAGGDMFEAGDDFADTDDFDAVCRDVVGTGRADLLRQWSTFVAQGA